MEVVIYRRLDIYGEGFCTALRMKTCSVHSNDL